jgi:iron complex transport system ATP-binding protein
VYQIKALNFSYGTQKILEGIDLSIQSRRFTTIIGPNGAGKTTLMYLLNGYLTAASGDIYFKGRRLGEIGIKERGRMIASIAQEVAVRFPFTCLEMVMLGRVPFLNRLEKPSENDMETVRFWMERTETSKFAKKPITELSGGEKQRVMLAKALAQVPEVLLLDEAFSAMDIHYEVKHLNMILDLVRSEGLTVIAIMHDLHMASLFSDFVIALDRGKVIHAGKTEEVMRPNFIRSLFHINVRRVGTRGIVVLP